MDYIQFRDKLGLTDYQFAKEFNVNYRTTLYWSSGKSTPPEYFYNIFEKYLQYKKICEKDRLKKLISIDDLAENLIDKFDAFFEICKKLHSALKEQTDNIKMCKEEYIKAKEEITNILLTYGFSEKTISGCLNQIYGEESVELKMFLKCENMLKDEHLKLQKEFFDEQN